MTRRTVLLLGPLLAGTAGCGVMLHGFHQDVIIRTEPPGAEVWRSRSQLQYWTPASIQLSRKRAQRLSIELPGYTTAVVTVRPRRQPGILALDILTSGPIGVTIDALTGAWNTLVPDDTSVVLTPIGPVFARDPATVVLGGNGPDLHVAASQPGVRVRLLDPDGGAETTVTRPPR